MERIMRYKTEILFNIMITKGQYRGKTTLQTDLEDGRYIDKKEATTFYIRRCLEPQQASRLAQASMH